MVTYVLWALPTIVSSVALGLLLGWMLWRGTGKQVAASQQDTVRQLSFKHDRDVAERDETISILREELAAEAAESARLRRILREQGISIGTPTPGSVSAEAAASAPHPQRSR